MCHAAHKLLGPFSSCVPRLASSPRILEVLYPPLATKCLQLFNNALAIVLTTNASSFGFDQCGSRATVPMYLLFSLLLRSRHHRRIILLVNWRPLLACRDVSNQQCTPGYGAPDLGHPPRYERGGSPHLFKNASWHAMLLAYHYTNEFKKGDKTNIVGIFPRMLLQAPVHQE